MTDKDIAILKKIIEEALIITRLIEGCDYEAFNGLAGLRDVTAHGYQTLRMEDIWDTVLNDIPLLRKHLGTMLDE
jgi:uncharacterized protein with HEPN domain